MTDKQQRFADEYLIDCNATRAYKAAYPNIKSDEAASAAGTRLLGNVNVKAYVEKRLAEISSAKIAQVEEVMEYLTSVLRGKSESEIVVVEGTGDGCSEARCMNKKPDEKEKLKAAELLGKRYGIFTDNVKASGTFSINVQNNLEDD